MIPSFITTTGSVAQDISSHPYLVGIALSICFVIVIWAASLPIIHYLLYPRKNRHGKVSK